MYKSLIITIAVLGIVASAAGNDLHAEDLIFGGDPKIIVIDPGHGGSDTGARGPSGSREKAVALTLARLLENELSNQFTVHMTRTEDYGLNAIERAASANQLNADLFISLHTGASFSSGATGFWVYYCIDGEDTNTGAEETSGVSKDPPPALIKWDHVYHRHRLSSQRLAHILHRQLTGLTALAGGEVRGLPLTVLTGVNMPAVLIEPGYLSNPLEEKCLQDRHCLSDIARAIAQGVDIFFSEKTEQPLETIDLQE